MVQGARQWLGCGRRPVKASGFDPRCPPQYILVLILEQEA
jgi:hypothetical protein